MRRTLPPRPQLNKKHPLTRDLVACFVSNGSGQMQDIIRGVRMASFQGAITKNTFAGMGGSCVGASGTGFKTTTPAHLKLSLPITLVWVGIPQTTPDVSAALAGIPHNNADTAPYVSAGFGFTAGVLGLQSNSAGTFYNVASGSTWSPNIGKLTVVGGSITAASQRLYINGKLDATSATARSNPTYGATSEVMLGTYSSLARNSNTIALYLLVYRRNLTAQEHQEIGTDPFCIFTRTGVTLAKAAASWYRWGRLRDEQMMSGGING